ncbi:hypothetical protein BD413DRAFT_609671 [Trametes elegans]|nr:hypothetical protein BD413DRAFT_609671 [Trametes elegans]
MSQGSYTTWQPSAKGGHDQYAGNPQGAVPSSSFQQTDSQRRIQSRAGVRSLPSSASSLSGAMGDAQLGVQPRTSVTPPSGLASWTPSPTSSTMSNATFMTVPNDTNMNYLAPVTPAPSASPSGAFGSFSQFNMSVYGSPEALSPAFSDQYGYPPDRTPPSSTTPMVISPSTTPAPLHPSRQSRSTLDDLKEENRCLQQRIHELEIVNQSARRRVRQLEQEVSRSAYPGGLPSPMNTPQATPTFDQEWHARTEARKKLLCSLNRAGNALCAWHDSRRERRAYPPRMAPPGHLNCGCTYEEALFEESLARHHVGSYLPGESVRMDPALRNPLLKLLQRRYGYRDGDFERDPVTGGWVNDEGAAKWEQKLASGASYSRRNRTEPDRRST